MQEEFQIYNSSQLTPYAAPPRSELDTRGVQSSSNTVRFGFGEKSEQEILLNDSESFGNPLGLDSEGNDPGLSSAYWNMGRGISSCLFFFLIFAIAIIVICNLDAGGILGGGALTASWTGQGAKRQNDRNIQVSSLWSGVVTNNFPSPIIYNVSNSTSSNPAINNGKVFYTIYDGDLIAMNEKTFTLIWRVNICKDLFKMSVDVCADASRNQLYFSVATPNIWTNEKLVISNKQPAAIIVIYQETGQLVSYGSGIENPLILDTTEYAEITQSGIVLGDDYYVGTSISDLNAEEDALTGCSFVGHFMKVNLWNMSVVWNRDMRSPRGLYPEGNEFNSFAGMPIRGSSPIISIRNNLVIFTTGPVHCASDGYWDCLEFTDYFDHQEECYDHPDFNETAQDSIVALDLSTGFAVWTEKLMGYRIWQLTCDPILYAGIKPDPCLDYPQGECPFGIDRYRNCGTKIIGKFQTDYGFRMDPTLQIHSDLSENLYVGQDSGAIYSIKVDRTPDNYYEVAPRSSRFLWATSVMSFGPGFGGLSADIGNVYFTTYRYRYSGNWYLSDNNMTNNDGAEVPEEALGGCGGYGALNYLTGLPSDWNRYVEMPRCQKRYDFMWKSHPAGIYSPPTVTNDILFITGGDVPYLDWTCCEYPCECECTSTTSKEGFGGTVYVVLAKNGTEIYNYTTGAGFYHQGIAVHEFCAFTGNGYLNSSPNGELDPGQDELGQIGHSLISWCVATPVVRECSII